MSLVEENLPGVGRVRKDFQVKEDFVIAKQLQEREYEDHFDANVQERRSAMQDMRMAKSFQNEEMKIYKDEEHRRRQLLTAQEELDRKEAEQYERELQRQEEEARMKDEELVQKLHHKEMKRAAKLQRREQEDMILAQRHADMEQKEMEEKRKQEILTGEKEARRLQQLETGGRILDLPTYESLGFSMPPPAQVEQEEGEDYVDEGTRMMDDDARLARELMENEQRDAQRRRQEQELADIEFARKLHEMESKKPNSGTTSSDEELAKRLAAAHENERKRQLEMQRKTDEELALKMRGDLLKQQSEQEFVDWELAKKLQKAEIVAHKKTVQQNKQMSPKHRPTPPTASTTQSLPPSFSANPGIANGRKGSDPKLTNYQMPYDSDEERMNSLPSAVPTASAQNYKRQPSGPGPTSKQSKKSSRLGKK